MSFTFNTNTGYDNFVLSNEISDLYESYLNLQNFFKVDRGLEGAPGMTRKINVYTATDGAEEVAINTGNTQYITVSHTTQDYVIKTIQNQFRWNDEEEMADPMIRMVGAQKVAVDMFNYTNEAILTELATATQTVAVDSDDWFSAFVDAQALLNVEAIDQGAPATFAFVSPADLAKIRKACKDTLQYVESFARAGYIGTISGTNLYVKRDLDESTVYFATKEALTLFEKKGVEVELYTKGNRAQADADIRLNTMIARKYMIPALTDATKAVKITIA